jgi:hypothetical protein
MPDAAKTALNIQVPAELKARLEEYANDHGLSQTATATIGLDQWLTAQGYPKNRGNR